MKCIVHIPYSLEGARVSATYLRPRHMAKAFAAIGYDVSFVSGDSKARRVQLNDLRARLDDGEIFDFCYFETCTSPTLLTDSDHLPRDPFLDYGFLAALKRRGVPVGVFLRDMHWRFSQYRNNVTFSKRLVATLFYHYDLLSFASLADVLFVPSFEFASFLPGYVKFPRVVELPPGGYPGCGPLNSMGSVVASAEKLAPWKMIYVGGCHPDLYDLRPLLEVLCDRPGFELTIVTRQEEWLRSFDFYKSFVSKLKERVKVVHAHGEELVRLYAQSDIACVVVADNEYFRIAYPLKLFEALGEGLPILSLGTGTISRFVQENQIGWNARSLGDLPGVIDEITTKGIVSAAKRARLISSHHSWNTRASKVRETLCPGAIDSSA